MKTERAVAAWRNSTALLRNDLSFAEWLSIGRKLFKIERQIHWLIGDWLRFGEQRYGKKYEEALRSTPYGAQTLMNFKWVASAFEFSRRREKLSWSHHAEVARLSVEEQEMLLDVAEAEGLSQKELRSARNRIINAVGTTPGNDTCAVADLEVLIRAGKKFGTIYADPPWPYQNQATRAATSSQYQTMSIEAIANQPVLQLAADDALLHVWTTNGFLFESKRIIESWGFVYKSCLIWCKPEIGLGNYWRVSHEFLLLGVRGRPEFRLNNQRSWIEHARTASHSSKPETIRRLVEASSPPPYLELFGRRPATGWVVWGNEIRKVASVG